MPFSYSIKTFAIKKSLINVHIKSPNWQSINFKMEKYCKSVIKIIFCGIFGNNFTKTSILISILLTNNENIRKLNIKYRNKNKSTNVLSFPFYKLKKTKLKNTLSCQNYLFLGDIVISFEKIFNESKKKKIFSEYFLRILVHGILHLLGYNHELIKDKKIMRTLEKEILRKINF